MGKFTIVQTCRKLAFRWVCSFIFVFAGVLGSPAAGFDDVSEWNVEEVVRGTVRDATGTAMPGVSILEKGTSNGTVSDADGKFTLNVRSSESVLV
jgi:hypothetical protein